jgi:predicted nucleotidyltransferase
MVVSRSELDQLPLARLADALGADPRITDAYLYGSALRSDHIPGTSDVDLLIIIVDRAGLDDYMEVASTVRCHLPRADVTAISQREFDLAIHPSGSRHFFVSVAKTGIHLYGVNGLAEVAGRVLDFNDTYRNTVQLCQRIRLVIVNPAKRHEREFWLAKLQHWIPCLLMELLHLHGAPERRLRRAHTTFSGRFPTDWADISYPYEDIEEVQRFLEALVAWLPENDHLFEQTEGSDAEDVEAYSKALRYR